MDIDQSIAEQIQARLTPQAVLAIEGYEYCGVCLSAAEVGGDSYDVVKMGPHRFGFMVADVSGKGLLGSLRMGMTLSEFRLRAEAGKNPSQCLAETNEAILKDIQGRRFVSMTFAALDVLSHEIIFASAGHNPVYIVCDGVSEIKSRGIALGIVSVEKFHTQEIKREVKPGDLMVFYSDGITEAKNNLLEEYGEGRLKVFLKKYQFEGLEKIRDGLFNEIKLFVKGAEQHDDMTLLLLRRRLGKNMQRGK